MQLRVMDQEISEGQGDLNHIESPFLTLLHQISGQIGLSYNAWMQQGT